MKRISVYNLARVQKAITGTDGKTYYLPPRTVKPLPNGVEIKAGQDRYLKVTFQESK